MKSLFLLLFSLATFSISAQSDWQLKKDKKDIKVFYRDAANSYIKELKIETHLNASLSTIMAFLYDVDLYPEWVYSCSEAKLEEKITASEVYYYSVMDFPWPMWDRDFIVHSTIHQDPKTGVIVTNSVATTDYQAAREDMIRIEEMNIRWTLTPLKNGSVKVEYYLKSNPGGNIPAWAINLALDRGPIQSINNLKKMIRQEKYQLAKLDFIDDFNTRRQ
ncbi:MAG: START domain-containing protein [Bacteroidota bacterium]